MRLGINIACVAAFGAFVAAFVAGCPAHVHLDAPPPPDAPEVVRASYYQTHRPERARRENFQMRSRVGSDAPAIALKSVTLKNGVKINHVEDLRVMVSEDSVTARSIAEALEARERANLVTGVGVGVGVLGIGLGGGMIVSEVAFATQPQQQDITAVPTLVLIGGGAFATGVIVGGGLAIWGMSARDAEDDATTRAFRSLDEDLRMRLALPPSETAMEPANEPHDERDTEPDGNDTEKADNSDTEKAPDNSDTEKAPEDTPAATAPPPDPAAANPER